MKHTPAPWKVMPHNTKQLKNRFWVTGVHQENNIQFVTVCEISKEKTEATARLIAAAPELLEALEAVLKLAEGGVIQRSETGKPQWNLTDELKSIARAAIAKAKEG